nr:MAG TPA: hypothetical protein [Microviridae sp.]
MNFKETMDILLKILAMVDKIPIITETNKERR